MSLSKGMHVGGETIADEKSGPSETDVEDAYVEENRRTTGMVLACFSPQNIDRLVSVYRAGLRAGRDVVVDLYTAAIATATGCESIPKPGFPRLRVFLSYLERAKVMTNRAFERVDQVRAFRIYPEELAARKNELVILFRP